MMTLVTSNQDKRKEIEAIMGTPLATATAEIHEIQSMDLEEVVRAKASAAYRQLQRPIIVEDTSLELESLGGFPGPFVKFWEKFVGYERTLDLIRGRKLTATAIAMAAYQDANYVVLARGEIRGTLTPRAGTDGFGFDYYFVPDGHQQTTAQLGRAVKNKISHRALCFGGLVEKLKALDSRLLH